MEGRAEGGAWNELPGEADATSELHVPLSSQVGGTGKAEGAGRKKATPEPPCERTTFLLLWESFGKDFCPFLRESKNLSGMIPCLEALPQAA